jgi:hypothetical protein
MFWSKVGCWVGAVATFGSVGGVGAYPQPQPQSALTALLTDAGPPRPVVTFPYSATFWAGPTGSTVWARRAAESDVLQFALPTTKPGPDPAPVPQPGPEWQPVTVWGARVTDGSNPVLLVGPPGTWWGAPADNLPTRWDAATGVLTLTLP